MKEIVGFANEGKDPEAAKAWAKGTDEVNANLIERGRTRADFVVAID